MQQKDFIEELKWRGMLHDHTPGVETFLSEGSKRAYIGFDPTASSLTIGNYVQCMILKAFQRCGHQPIVLMGGATGRIGDPSGKDQERDLKPIEELNANLEFQKKQIETFLAPGPGEKEVIFRNNYDFYKDMNVLDFLREVGKTLTVNYMMSKESVKKRLETGISYTEFSYQLIQAFDFQCLYDQDECHIQMGGSDQWGNITSGTEFIRRNINGKAYAVTTPLLTKADGTKFGKSEGGNIWMDGEMTSPYKFFQFWINADDKDLGKFLRYFSYKSRAEIEALEAEHIDDPRALKSILAEELTTRVHGEEAYNSVNAVSTLLFSKKADADYVKGLTVNQLKMVAGEIPAFEVEKTVFDANTSLIDLITDHAPIVSSKGDARRAIKGNALSVNRNKISDMEATVASIDLLREKFLLVENGKKNKFLLVVK